MILPFELSPATAIWMAAASFGAGFVRGYSGFGFAALIVTSAALVTDPLVFVPVVVLADLVLTAQQARGIRADIDWRRAGALFAGCLAGVPVSIWALGLLGVDGARMAVSAFVLVMCAVLAVGWRRARAGGDEANLAVGLVSGLANGAAVGGLPVAAWFAAQPMAAATFRATLIAYFTLLDLWTLPLMMWAGMVSGQTLMATALLLPVMSLGVWAGGRRFLRTEPREFRRFAILLLSALAGAGLVRSL
ncbi:MAG: TSUP family transporter [Gemmobacter sp.]